MRAALSCVLALALAAPISLGQGQSNGKGKGKGGGAARGGSGQTPVKDIRFGEADTRIILDYYRPRIQQLPPGLQKKLMRGGTLPPGWQKKISPFPDELSGRLGPLPGGCRRVMYGRTALLVQDATNVILDVLELAR